MSVEFVGVSPEMLLGEVLRMKNKGYRLVAMSCAKKDGMEITYSFSKDMEFLNLRMNIEPETEIDSISSIYSYSFLYENEIKELYGIKINGISLDYNDNFYRIAVKTPFNMKKEGE